MSWHCLHQVWTVYWDHTYIIPSPIKITDVHTRVTFISWSINIIQVTLRGWCVQMLQHGFMRYTWSSGYLEDSIWLYSIQLYFILVEGQFASSVIPLCFHQYGTLCPLLGVIPLQLMMWYLSHNTSMRFHSTLSWNHMEPWLVNGNNLYIIKSNISNYMHLSGYLLQVNILNMCEHVLVYLSF